MPESNELGALLVERKRRTKTDLLRFIQEVRDGYQANWHHRVICDALMDWIEGRGPARLMLFMPASNGKSEIVSRCLPAYLLGRKACKVIACSHTQTLADEMSTDVRNIMASEPYQQLFGLKTAKTGAVESWRTLDGGHYVCAGVGGPVTGKHFDFGIIDDPIKNAEEAFSEVMREKVWQWYTRVFRTRRIGGGARMLLTSTRWHEDDLAGRILEREKGKWTVLQFPAIDERDKRRGADGALWPERYSRAFLEEEKELNKYAFESLYQQRPVAEGGGMFKRAWFKYAEKNGSPTLFKLGDTWRNIQDGRRFCTVDLATSVKTSADYTAIVTGVSFKSGDLLILNVRQERIEGPDIIPAIRQEVNAWNCGDAWIERIGFQTSLIQDARRQGLPVRELNPDKDKVTRAAPLAALFAGGKVFFAPGDWRIETERELLTFPAGAHDDIVDALAYQARVHNDALGESFKRFALKI